MKEPLTYTQLIKNNLELEEKYNSLKAKLNEVCNLALILLDELCYPVKLDHQSWIKLSKGFKDSIKEIKEGIKT